MTLGYVELCARRLVGFALVLLVLSLMTFVLARVVPGDPARMALGPSATPEQVAALQVEMGFDKPLPEQYLLYLGNAVKGDFGKSLVTGRPVTEEIMSFLPATLELVIVTICIIICVAIPLGVITARYRNSWIDSLGRVFSLTGVTMPSFLFAILLQMLAATYFPQWPILGRVDHTLGFQASITGFMTLDALLCLRFDVFFSAVQHLVFPAIALSMSGIGQITRITRSAMIEHQRRDHTLTLRSFGVPQRVITFRYLLKLSSIAPITILGLEFAALIGNAFVVEMVFSWGGFASYGLEAILQKDLNAVMAVVMVAGIFFIVANLVIDIILALLDPRLRFKEAK
ncbi:ABC transporter permease [Rhodobacteraceae bacterium RKSG542]|uniref:ABC transporter permease n=1 Tax=Pseudovibrio flavus TaxID=2529854 RepID=UPI0012BD3B13|nr:ABC transporter permease [Pseudovibrio flavus]MTI16137.1 ABC transporter permease [Pseudovibrio flavus]